MKYTLHPSLEDGTDRGFRNVGKPQSDAGEIPKRIHTIIHTNYYKIVKKLKSFKIIRVAPTCLGLHKPSSRSSQPVLR